MLLTLQTLMNQDQTWSEESSMETISNFTEEEPINDDEESNIDNKEEIVHNNEENVVNDVNLKQKFDRKHKK